MNQRKIQHSSSSSEENTVLTKATISEDVGHLIELSKKSGINQALWDDLCLAAAKNHGSSAEAFKNRLIDNIGTIGIQYISLVAIKFLNGSNSRSLD